MEQPVLVQVRAPHFTAGLVFELGVCTVAAPILRYCIGKSDAWCRTYFHRKGWAAIVVTGSGSCSGSSEVPSPGSR